MTNEDYQKFFIGSPNDVSKAELLRQAIANARKREGKLAGYRKLRRKSLYRIVQKIDKKDNER